MNLALKPRKLAAFAMVLALAKGATAQSVTSLELGSLGGSTSVAVGVNDRQQGCGHQLRSLVTRPCTPSYGPLPTASWTSAHSGGRRVLWHTGQTTQVRR